MTANPARHLVAGLALLAVAGCAAPERTGATSLVGPLWQWHETLMSDDTRIVAPAPERYTIEFVADGSLRIQADCNRGSSRYAVAADGRLDVAPIATTRRMCPPGTQDAAFLRGLANLNGYLFDGQDLVLMLKVDSGTMRFRPAAR